MIRTRADDPALLFESLTRWVARIWLTLQVKWDLCHALRARGQRPKVKALPSAGGFVQQGAPLLPCSRSRIGPARDAFENHLEVVSGGAYSRLGS